MSVSFVRPDVSHLEIHLYGRSVHPELFTVHNEAAIWQDDFQAEIKLCDAGHTVSFQYRGDTITEVTATQKQPLPHRKRMLKYRLRGSRDASYRFESGVNYQISYQLEKLDPEVFLSYHEELLIDCERATVANRFPALNRLAPGPISLIRTDVSRKSLLIHAFHTFPESCAVVKTQSLFEI